MQTGIEIGVLSQIETECRRGFKKGSSAHAYPILGGLMKYPCRFNRVITLVSLLPSPFAPEATLLAWLHDKTYCCRICGVATVHYPSTRSSPDAYS
ncbi:hypothetical protein KQX54_005011 [Cotesia glomerata]|uniref:Uncharacterized protein n=1 Tax=Cotesia glomerata TaxID=32391 RepID=A0AAV7ICY6_COTGL|nr:hypothetical protein KQX54_005011 [Cotesia glomerata]